MYCLTSPISQLYLKIWWYDLNIYRGLLYASFHSIFASPREVSIVISPMDRSGNWGPERLRGLSTFPLAGWYRYWPPPHPPTLLLFHSIVLLVILNCICSALSIKVDTFEDIFLPQEVNRGWCRWGRLLKYSGASEILDLCLSSATNQLCDFSGHVPSFSFSFFSSEKWRGSHKTASKPKSLSRPSLTFGCLTAGLTRQTFPAPELFLGRPYVLPLILNWPFLPTLLL